MLTWADVLEVEGSGNPSPGRRVERTDEAWRELLTPEQYRVTRGKGTERPFSSELCALFEPGLYACVCCDTLLFDSEEKFESGTGWPSFTQPVDPAAVAYHVDDSLGMTPSGSDLQHVRRAPGARVSGRSGTERPQVLHQRGISEESRERPVKSNWLVVLLGVLVVVPLAPLPAGAQTGSPAAAPQDWLLAFVDVETTGLIPGYHEMIDLGLVMTDLEGTVIDSLFLRIQPAHPERLSEGARDVNAFDADRWQELGALSPGEAIDSLVHFHQRVAEARTVMLVAFNSWFDAAFVDHLFRSQDSSWRTLYHYFVLDIPSMAWAMGYRDLTGAELARRLGVADEPHVAEEHTGITGAMLNVRLYQALRARGLDPLTE